MLHSLFTQDPDYTFLAMTRFAEGKKQFWGKICAQVRCVHTLVTDIIGKRSEGNHGRAIDKIPPGGH